MLQCREHAGGKKEQRDELINVLLLFSLSSNRVEMDRRSVVKVKLQQRKNKFPPFLSRMCYVAELSKSQV